MSGNWVPIETVTAQGFFKGKIYVGDITKEYRDELRKVKKEVAILKEYKENQEEIMAKNAEGELKEPATEQEFLNVRRMVELINKNLKRPENVGQVWGTSGEFSSINSAESLKTWFDSDHRKKFTTQQVRIDLADFEVFMFEGDLTTLSKDFEGGVGVESLWSDQISRSPGYKSTEHLLNDPRRGYKFEGKRWQGCSKRSPGSTKKKTKSSAKKKSKHSYTSP